MDKLFSFARTSMAVSLSEVAEVIADRERKGADWCAKRGVGNKRRALGNPLPPNVSLLVERIDPRFDAEKQRQQAAEIWQAVCQSCPLGKDCEWARK